MTGSTGTIPRPEHPNPQFERPHWRNLNGKWDFELDLSASGFDREAWRTPHFNSTIIVPFCPESTLSGIGFTDFIAACWYHRTVEITADELSGLVYLHFGAVDYEAHVYINGAEVGLHKGGYASFRFEISKYLHEGANDIVVGVKDDVRSAAQPGGKQSDRHYSYDCMYTRTTGIWQTVWLEYVPQTHIDRVRYYPNIDETSVTIEAKVSGQGRLRAEVSFAGNVCGKAETSASNGLVMLTVPLAERHLWKPGEGNLYDVALTFGEDTISSYFGLRELRIDGYRFLINGESVFQRLVLDQGFYPDGIYTAPDEQALVRDIELSLAAGFNGARLHEKAFEPRFLYHCDRLGYIAWGEMANWGLDISDTANYASFIPEWMELVERDFNHPAIVGWCPFNETWDQNGRRQIDDILRLTYNVTKALDPTRPCIDTSGHYHVVTDIYDIHDYDQDPESFRQKYAAFAEGKDTFTDVHAARQTYPGGIPFFISEYGGIKWIPPFLEDIHSWGYGDAATSEEEYIARYKALTDPLIDDPNMFGFCYTQLYDVEQECNGVYAYDRRPKVSIEAIASINRRKAAIEQ
ncbi:beta-galactosidase [Bifidobacterium pullorum subsp. saeculare]|uniref:glycoside hydrolase family 2 protein n=1 Tax=Bifidobacterium pullorum TaxID=78448 RepID=UPI00195E058A|nr:sugar-binding domain-containing protein [Bifidobacterium pullorum]MBM6695785.1 beta-galactosidase [Bifidobacterium pullorum subsp. saeculare]